MGSSSKVILVGATSLIIGIYASSLKAVQYQHIQTAEANVQRVQHMFAADAALRSALNTYVNNGAHDVSETKTLPGGVGTFDNKIHHGWFGTAASVTITYPDSSTQTLTATVTKMAPGQYYKLGARKIHKNGYIVSQIFASPVNKKKSKS